jgi:enterobactin synthetase component D
VASSDDEQLLCIREALQHVAKRCAGLHIACIGDGVEELLAAEAVIAAEFTAAKRLEFARGRTAARNAVLLAGGERAPIASSGGGVPLFPNGIVGSISHKYRWAIAVATRSSGIRSVGVDLEYDDERDEEDLLTRVCIDSERSLVSRLQAAGYRSPATWLHCAKEAAYKAHFAVDRVEFDYDEIELSLDEENDAFQVVRIEGATDLSVRGVYARSASWLVSLAIIVG